MFTVSGKIQQLSYSEGGMEIDPSELNPLPLGNTDLYVVQYLGIKEKSIIVTQISSDENGNYKVKLPPGNYGFVQDKSEIHRGTFLPQGDNYGKNLDLNDDFGYQDYWELNTLQPFQVDSTDISNINITHYSVSICYTCP